MARLPGLFQRGSVWWLRVMVPLDVRGAFDGRSKVVRSLLTEDRREASRLGAEYRAHHLRVFALRRNGSVGIETTPHLCPFTVRANMGRMVYAGALPVRLYAGGGTQVTFEFLGFGTSPSRLAFVGVSGYLVDQP